MTARARLRLVCKWTAVFAANLLLPFWFGQSWVSTEGMTGLWMGVGLLWILGSCMCLCSRNLGKSLVIGSIATAIMQVLPIVHVIVGIMALEGWSNLSGAGPWDEWTEYKLPFEGGFAVTMWTGVPIAIFALLFGAAMRSFEAREVQGSRLSRLLVPGTET